MSQGTKIKVEVRKDHLNKIAQGTPLQCLAELIWNALDADATTVAVEVKETALGAPEIHISDNGSGFPHADARSLFSYLGGSWKAQKRVSPKHQRQLHGAEGKGRFKAFTLGRAVTWSVTYRDGASLKSFTIEATSDNIQFFTVSAEKPSQSSETGVEVTIGELHHKFKLLDLQYTASALSPLFALYLADYPDVSVTIGTLKLDPQPLISARTKYDLASIETEEGRYSAHLEIVEWNSIHERQVHLCNGRGFPLARWDKTIKGIGSDFSFTAYIKSDYFELLEAKGALMLGEMDASLVEIVSDAESKLREHFRAKQLQQSADLLEKWRKEQVYPYKEEPKDAIETAGREVFDIVAINVAESIPHFEESDRTTKAFQLRMLRQAIENSPAELQSIISEVLELPKAKQAELAELLQETTLDAIINAAKIITDRLKFIAGLEEVLFNPDIKAVLKERSQLHRMLAPNTWIFGDAFSLTVDDQSLTEVLKQHLSAAGLDAVINEPVTRANGKKGIVDLMLSRGVPRNHGNEREHLVIELKAPNVTINQKSIGQIESYAFAVAADARFRSLNTRWHFWILSTDLDDYAKQKRNQQGFSGGVIYRSDPANGKDITIWVKTWSEIIAECKHRMEYIRSQLQINIGKDEGYKHLKAKYPEYTKGLPENQISKS